MNTNQQKTANQQSCDIHICPLLAQELDGYDFDVRQKSRFPMKALMALAWQRRRLYGKVMAAALVAAVVIALSLPNYYTCKVMLAPELSGGKGTSSLANLASSFGVNLNGNNQSADALFPTLYPDLMNSVAFRASLFPIRVQAEEEGMLAMSYYDYLKNEQRVPWWTSGMKAVGKAIASLFVTPQLSEEVNPFKLTKEQYELVELMGEKVVCNVDKMTMVITINVTDQDPQVAAMLADSVQQHLQQFITDYRTRKARIDLEYNQKLFAEAKDKYETARQRYAAYSDANQKVFLQSVRSKVSDYENELQLQLRAYSQVAAQLQMAEAKVQEDTPAFTTLQPATVPVKKAGPKRSLLCMAFLVLAFMGTTCYLMIKYRHALGKEIVDGGYVDFSVSTTS